MRPSLALAAVVATTAVTAPAYAAKPQPFSCRTVDDADAGPESSMDVHRATVTFGPKTITALLVLDRTRTQGEPAALVGPRWTVAMQMSGGTYTFQRHRSAGNTETYRYEVTGSPRGTLTPNVVETPTTVRWTIPRSAFPTKPRYVCEVSAAAGYGAVPTDSAGPQHR